MSTSNGEIARFNLLAGGVMDEREARRLAGDPSALAFRAEPRPVAPELIRDGRLPLGHIAFMDAVEFTPQGSFPLEARLTSPDAA